MKPKLYLTLSFLAFLLAALTFWNMRDSSTGWPLWASYFLPPMFLLCALMIPVEKYWKHTLLLVGPWLFLAGSLTVVSLGEALLTIAEKGPTKITMPKDWEWQPHPLPDTPDSFRWQGVVHKKDKNGMRRLNGAWPTRHPDTRVRILVVGDSLTYGLGVEESLTYPSQLQALLPSPKYEVLNLGIVGYNSTQILNVLKEHIPLLKPDLIIYGICLNDLLPVEKAEEHGDDSFSPPIPYWIRDPLISKTRLGAAINTGYNKLLLTLGWRENFIDQVFSHPEYKTRFYQDVKEMQELTKIYGLPPLIAIVLDQYPKIGSKSYELAEEIPQKLVRMDANSVIMSRYYREHDGKTMFVSPWEGHPNEEAYRIWANILANFING